MCIYHLAGHLIRRVNQISVATFLDSMQQAGIQLTPVQYSALATIQSVPGIDQATLAGRIAYDRATLGKVIDRLEQRALVERSVSPKDRRSKCLSLSPLGQQILAQAQPLVESAQPKMMAGLTEGEQTQLLALLDKIAISGNKQSRAPLVQNAPQSD
ncbi:MarR family transcriptional regulator [Phaeobacter gallaeciensis]|uniref:MarR family transcriptional regulator n=2 Tax=Roseobacteraceae TaxID=2854170 RepID=A0A366WIB2_9RHOB|nr:MULTISPECIES: MarR family transcriptional regulator [Roseobacteraceae]MBT3143699.1 MarR family transcriptional regulator [Falsiruegeria litorea]MBT8167969.1 MarR family transcriptional regulator [Falsiruegeria litorea]RBW49540.1 MarR family transcriptional regulator [Phaeobacter gallaeciensis]